VAEGGGSRPGDQAEGGGDRPGSQAEGGGFDVPSFSRDEAAILFLLVKFLCVATILYFFYFDSCIFIQFTCIEKTT
jgi:hypothetical protein